MYWTVSAIYYCVRKRSNSEWNPTTFLCLHAEKCTNRLISMLNCDSPQDLPHFFDIETDSEASFSQTVPPPGHPQLPRWWKRKQANMSGKDTKVYGCASMIKQRWVSLLRWRCMLMVNMLCPPPAPYALTQTHMHAQIKKNATMTSSVRDVKVPEDWMWQTWFVMTCTTVIFYLS